MTSRPEALPTQEMTINMGPQHPSTHGVLRAMARFYPWIKTGGDQVSADGRTFSGLTGLYNGPTLTATIAVHL